MKKKLVWGLFLSQNVPSALCGYTDRANKEAQDMISAKDFHTASRNIPKHCLASPVSSAPDTVVVEHPEQCE